MPDSWRIQLLGELRVQRGQEPPVRFETRHTAALLAYLAFYGNRSHSREVVAEQLSAFSTDLHGYMVSAGAVNVVGAAM